MPPRASTLSTQDLQRPSSQAFESQGLGLASPAAAVAAEAGKTAVVEQEGAEVSAEHSVDVAVGDNCMEVVAFD